LPLTAVVALALAASPAAAQQDFPGLPGLGGPAKSFAEMADLSARVVPKEAKRGDVVTYEITVKPKRGAWTYPVNPPDPTQSRTRFAFPVAADKGTKPEDVVLVLAEPVADPPGATWEDHPDNGKVARVSYKPVKWEPKAAVSPKTTPGKKTIRLDDIGSFLQVCDNHGCFQAPDFPVVELKVLAGDPA